ncbi:MAG: hypothetical protein LBQ06_08085 [Frankiaceae bacterium]|jgi:NADH:ubiquinone oxidoreductase subunit F (NADH-binding)|nr:hypothetical protein [Frankiaceae bacterium]
MSESVRPPSPVPYPHRVNIRAGPALLAGADGGPSLAAHWARYGSTPAVDLPALVDLVERVGLRGRGGAAFPFAAKLRAAASGRHPLVVVNLSEGEPSSAKDAALAMTSPHLVLDGALGAAGALGAREVHLVLPGERAAVRNQMRQAVAERTERVRFRLHTASPRFVSGQTRAVIELMSGRPNLPVTAWSPEAVAGYRGRPTLLSNAETWAHVGLLLHVGPAAYARHGTPEEPGTALLTVTVHGAAPDVWEVPFGTRLSAVLPRPDSGAAALVGGYHGAWAMLDQLADVPVSVSGMARAGLPLGAGIVYILDPSRCPLAFTWAVVDYLAGQSAGRCGPCVNGLPALAASIQALLTGHDEAERLDQLARSVAGRGACAHPDGTARLVRSVFTALPEEVAAHRRGRCVARRSSLAPV